MSATLAYGDIAAAELAAEAAREEARRARLDTWIAEADMLLFAIEELNMQGVQLLPVGRIREIDHCAKWLRELGGSPPAFKGGSAQEAVDHVLDELLARALVMKWPGLAEALDDEARAGG